MYPRLLPSLVLAAGCGRIGFDLAGTSDASDASSADACTLGGFTAPRELAEVDSTTQDWGPWISPDGTTIVFASQRSGDFQIYQATRASTTQLFDPPTLVTTTGVVDVDDPYLSPDQLRLWFDTNNGGGVTGDLYEATRATPTDPFANTKALTELDTDPQQLDPSLTVNELAISFDSDRNGGLGAQDMYLGTRSATTDQFVTQHVDILSTAGVDCCGTFTDHDRALVYASQRGATGPRVLVTTTFDGASFGTPSVLDPILAGDGDDSDPSFTADGTTMVFSSTRSGGTGAWDLYITTRPCE